MTTITTRAGKGSALTWDELDANQTGLNSGKAELSGDTFTGTVTIAPSTRKYFSFTSIVGGEGEGLAIQSDSMFNIFVGKGAGAANVYAGTGGGLGSANTSVGYQTLAANTDGKYNSAFGTHALNAVTTGSSNTCIGPNGCLTLTTGSNNITLGHDAMGGTSVGVSNCVAIGRGALETPSADYNTAIGPFALGGATVSGNYNTAVGYNALNLVSSGASNFALGLGAGTAAGVGINGASTTTGGQNCFIGTYSGGTSASSSNEFVCGGEYFNIFDVYFNKGVVHSTPSNWTLHGTGGFGSNIAGGSVTVAGGIGTGTGAGGDIIFKSAKAGSTGSTANTLAEAFKVSGTGPCVVLSGGGVTVANLPAAIQGAKAFVTDATATTFASTVVGGGANKVPVYCDGTNWKIG